MRARVLLASTLCLTFLALAHPAWAWSNGGYSADPNNPDYGTHDWIAERALDWLPANEKALILSYRAVYLYGTELPDNCQAVDKLCDTGKHHVYFYSSGALQDNASARRALDLRSQALSAIASGDYATAAKWTGAMTHYIADLASFGHVMGSATDWGAEPESVHSDYENHAQTLTNSRDASLIPLTFDGTLAAISPYDAALALAHDTTFDDSGAGHSAVWMNRTDNWNDPVFAARAYQSINLAVNYVAEAVHSVWSGAITQQTTTTTSIEQATTTSTQETMTTTATSMTTQTSQSSTPSLTVDHVVINEFEQNPPGDDRGSEFVELFNPTQQTVDMSGWIICTTHGDIESYTIPAGTLLAPGGFWQVTFPGLFIDNEQDSLVLLNGLGQHVDETPSLADTKDDLDSWQRYADGSENWVFAPSTRSAINVPELAFPSILIVAMILALTLLTTRRKARTQATRAYQSSLGLPSSLQRRSR